VLFAVTQQWDLLFGQDISIQRHLSHTPVDAVRVFHANLIRGFAVAVGQFVARPVYGNAGGDWTGCIADQYGINGNISEDPLFCDAENGDFTIRDDYSPCAPANNPECGLIGALGVDCIPILGVGDSLTPLAIHLEQAFPNPFNPSTTIRFSLPVTQAVRLNVYAVDGKHIAALVNEQRPPGPHSVTWNGTDDNGQPAASGTYVYRLEAGEFVEAKRLTLVH